MPLDSLLSKLENAQLIRQLNEPDPAYIFKNVLSQQAAYQSLLTKNRREIHRHVAESYEMLYENELDEYAALLAQHYAEAGDDAKTLEYAQLAGDASARVYANTEAIMHYTRALDLVKRVPALEGAPLPLQHLYLSRGRALELAGRYNDALQNYDEMQSCAQERGDRAIELAALIALATVRSTPTIIHDAAEAQSLADRALVLARELGDRKSECRILWTLQNLCFFTSRHRQGIEFGEQALSIARELDLQEQLAYILNDINRIYLSSGQITKAKQAVTESRELWKRVGNLPMLADNFASAAEINEYAGELDDALENANQAIEIAKSIDNPWVLSYALWVQSIVLFERGEVDKALSVMLPALEYARKAGFAAGVFAGSVDLAFIYAQLGAFDRAIDLIQTTLKDAGAAFSTFHPWGYGFLSRTFVRRGDLESAAVAFEQAQASYPHGEFVVFLAAPLTMARADLAFAQKEYDAAVAAADKLIESYRQYGTALLLLDAFLVKGQALARQGKPQEAFDTLAQARAIAEKMNSRRVLWQVLLEQSQVDEQLGKPTEARELRAQAGEIVDYIANHISDVHLRAAFLAIPQALKVIAG